MKNIQILSFAALTLLVSCRQEISEKNSPSIVESYSPGYVITGDTVSVIGQFLDGASVSIGSVEVAPIKTTSNEFRFIVPGGVTDGPITVNSSSTSHTFSTDLIVNHKISDDDKSGWLKNSPQLEGEFLRGPKQLLITDFDGAGIRIADATDQFDETQWSGVVASGGSQEITNSFSGVNKEDNFYAVQVSPELVQRNSCGFVSEFFSRGDLLNDRFTDWINGFSDYPSSPIGDLTNDTYLNVVVHRNNKVKGQIRVSLGNDNLSSEEYFAYNIPMVTGLAEWEIVSVKVRRLRSNYGYSPGSFLGVEDFLQMNKVRIDIQHSDWAGCEETEEDLEGDVQFMIDHIILTEGAPYFGQP